jgi:hypothetical protein
MHALKRMSIFTDGRTEGRMDGQTGKKKIVDN